MAEAAIPVAVEMITKPVVDSITTQLNYIRNYKINLATLQSQLLNLQYRRDVKQSEIDQAERNGDEIFELAQNWLDRANKTMNEAQELIEHNNRLNMQCFKNMCPNLKKRYVESKKVAMMMEAVSKLYDEGAFDTVSYPTLPAETWLPDGYENIASRQSTLDGILDALRADDANMVGVYGLGGSGKTTMVKEVAKKAEEGKLFDKVVFVKVTDTVDIGKIQKEIAERLGSKFYEESESVIADRLRTQIKKENKILLILDDIWKYLDLGAVGIPFGKDHMGCKLLFTSRDVNVLNEMESKINFPVAILQKEEACNLFMKITGVGEEQHALRELAIEVAEECGGLLVAIITIAKALRNKPDNEWRIALQELRNPPSIENVEDSVVKKAYTSIRLSYKQLKSEKLKSIFLLCSIMGSTHDVSIEELSRYTVGLSLFTENVMDDVRDRVKSSVRKLKDASLLLGTLDDETLSIHDVVRDVGRWIAHTDQHNFMVINDVIPQHWVAAENSLENCTSIILHDIDEVPQSLDCPQVKFFYMKPKTRFPKMSDSFFRGMPKLEVLHLIRIDLSPLPASLCSLKKLRMLNLDQCHLGDIVGIKDMKTLVILVIGFRDARGSIGFKELPKEIGDLTSLRLLGLTKCGNLKNLFSFSIAKHLSQLQEIEVVDCQNMEGISVVDRTDDGVNVPLLVNQLRSLTLKSLPRLKGIYSKSEAASLSQESQMPLTTDASPSEIISEYLLDACTLLDEKVIFPNLTRLIIEKCNNLKYIFSSSTPGSFKHLRHLEIHCCDDLEALIRIDDKCSNYVEFQSLEQLHIRYCPKLREIVFSDKMVAKRGVVEVAAARFSFPKLTSLHLLWLHELRCFYLDKHTTEWPKLKYLEVTYCYKIDYLFSFQKHDVEGHLDDDQIALQQPLFSVDEAFSNLEKVRMANRTSNNIFLENSHLNDPFPKLKFLIVDIDESSVLPLDSFERFKNLEKLQLISSSYKEIFSFEEIEEHVGTLSQLRSLYLDKLHHLKQLWKQDSKKDLIFQKLKSLQVGRCDGLIYLMPPSAYFENLKILKVAHCRRLVSFVATSTTKSLVQQEMSIEANKGDIMQGEVTFNRLKSLELEELKNLISFNSGNCILNFPLLEKLTVTECPKMKFFSSGVLSTPRLQEVCLDRTNYKCELVDLNKIIKSHHEKMVSSIFKKADLSGEDIKLFCQVFPHHSKVFSNTKKLRINGNDIGMIWQNQFFKLERLHVFNDESTVFPLRIFQRFQSVEKLELKSSSYEEVFSYKEVEKPAGILANVKCLHLSFLDDLKQIWKKDSKLTILQHLESLDVERCASLVNVLLPSSSFKHLKILRVSACARLKSLVAASTARSLVQLEEMTIDACEMMTEVVAKEGDVIEDEIIFYKLKKLELIFLSSLASLSYGSYTFKFPLLEEVTIENCHKLKVLSSGNLSTPKLREVLQDDMEYICENDFNEIIQQHYHEMVFSRYQQSFENIRIILHKFPEHQQVFSNLVELSFSKNEIGMIGQNQFPQHLFPKLKILHVSEDESKVFPLAILERFHNVDYLRLDCGLYEKIFSNEDVKKHAGSLAQIKGLFLYRLDDLKQMWKQDLDLDLILQNLEILEVNWCGSLVYLVPASSSFQNLARLSVKGCNGLRNLVAPSVAKSLVQLEEMEIRQCNMMTGVISSNEGSVTEDEIIFKNLKILYLSSLSSLTSFYSGNCTINFPCLHELIVKNCPKIRLFSLGVLKTPELDYITHGYTEHVCDGDLNATIQEIHEKLNATTSPEDCAGPSTLSSSFASSSSAI